MPCLPLTLGHSFLSCSLAPGTGHGARTSRGSIRRPATRRLRGCGGDSRQGAKQLSLRATRQVPCGWTRRLRSFCCERYMSGSVSVWLGPPPPPTPPPPPPLPCWQDHEVSSNYCPCHYKELNKGCSHCALVWLQSARKHGIEEHIARYAWFTWSLGGTRKEVEEACTSAYDDTNGVKETSPANKIRVRKAAS